jgi:hypothetical protein
MELSKIFCEAPPSLAEPSYEPRHLSRVGLGSDCPRAHRTPDTRDCNLDGVRWLHLGHGREPLSCRAWHDDGISSWPHVGMPPRSVSFDKFCASLGLSPEELRDRRYVCKLPCTTESKPYPVATRHDLEATLFTMIDLQTSRKELWCRNPPPVIVICTLDQFSSCSLLGWLDILGHADESVLDSAGSEVAVVSDAGQGSTDDDDDGDDDDEERAREPSPDDDDNLLRSASRHGDLGDSPEMWKSCCSFWGLDPADFDAMLSVPGISTPIRPYQALDAYKTLQTAASGAVNGVFNCGDVGVGKTLVSLVVQSAVALAHLSKAHVERYRQEHQPGGTACGHGSHAFGVACWCLGGLTRTLTSALPQGPHVVVMLPSTQRQWARSWLSHMAPKVTLRDSRDTVISKHPLLSIGQRQQEQPGGAGSPVPVDFDTSQHLLHGVRQHGPILPFTGPEKIRWAAGDLGPYRISVPLKELLRRSGSVHLAPPAAVPALAAEVLGSHPSRLVLFKSSNEVSRGRLDADTKFAVTLETESRSGKGSRTTLQLSSCLLASTVTYDEWPESRSKECNLIKSMTLLVNAAPDHRPVVALLSATPIKRGFGDLVGAVPLLDRDGKLLAQVQQLPSLLKSAKEGSAKAAAWDQAKRSLGPCIFHRPVDQGFYRSKRAIVVLPRLVDHAAEGDFSTPQGVAAEVRKQMSLTRRTLVDSTDLTTAFLFNHSKDALRLHILEMLPTAVRIERAWLDSGYSRIKCFGHRGLHESPPPSWVPQLACPQLRRLLEIVLSVRPTGEPRHSLIVAFSPAVAAAIALWLHSQSDRGLCVVLVGRDTVPPADRAELISTLRLRSRDPQHSGQHIVVVASSKMLAHAFDGFQGFADIVVTYGSTHAQSDRTQALGRVWRHGSISSVVDSYYLTAGRGTYEGTLREQGDAFNLEVLLAALGRDEGA